MFTQTHEQPSSHDLSDEAYHAITDRLSCSQLKVAHRSLSEFHARFVARTIPDTPSTKAMDIGSIADAVLLSGMLLRSLCAAWPEECYKSNGTLQSASHASRQEFAEYCAEEGIAYILKLEELQRVRDIVSAVRNSVFGPGIERCTRQYAVFWTDPETDLACRLKYDFLDRETGIVYDLKVTSFVGPAFRRAIVQHKYWLQEQHYCAGLSELLRQPIRMLFVTVNVDPPHQVSVHSIGESDSYRQYRELLRSVRYAIDTEDWRDWWQDEIVHHELKQWELTK